MSGISQAERDERALARARKKFKEKGVFLRSIKDGIGIFDVTVDEQAKRFRLPLTSTVDEFRDAVKSAIECMVTKTEQKERPEFQALIDLYIEKRQFRPTTIPRIRLYLHGYSYDEKANAKLVRELMTGTLSQATKRVRFKAVRAFFRYAKETLGVQIADPTQGEKIPKEGQPRTRIPTDGEISQLLLALEKQGKYRDLLFVRLLIYTGARCSSIAILRPCDMVDWRLNVYNVKMDRQYSVRLPVTDKAIRALWDTCTCGLKPDALVFEPGAPERLRDRMRRMFPRTAEGSISPHSFRHLRCTQLARDGVHVSMAAKLLDASPQVLLRTYTTISQDDVDEMFAASAQNFTSESISDAQANNCTNENKTPVQGKFRVFRRM